MQQYLDLIRDIRDNGVDLGGRRIIKKTTDFGRQNRFDLNESFTIITPTNVQLHR